MIPCLVLFVMQILLPLSLILAILNRYNKSLLGDHMGKFPAPFLMNTIHFAMQAVLSKFITWFWSHRFESDVVMSWNDYFLRGTFSSLLPHSLYSNTAYFIILSRYAMLELLSTFD